MNNLLTRIEEKVSIMSHMNYKFFTSMRKEIKKKKI